MSNGSRFAHHFTRACEHVCNCSLCLLGCFSCKCVVMRNSSFVGKAVRCFCDQTTIARNDCSHVQLQFAPPNDVGEVTKRAAHCDASAFVDLSKWMCKYWHFNIEEGSAHRGTKERFVPLIIGVCNDRDARRQQFRASCINKYVAAAIRFMERNGVIRARTFTIFKFCLSYCSAKVNVPQCWCFLRVCLTACEVSQKCTLTSAT